MEQKDVKEYRTIGWASLSPDIYCGPHLNEHTPQWKSHMEGDMESETLDILTYDAKHFPAGTIVRIKAPLCPECSSTQEFCECGYDWKLWIENENQ